MENEEWLNDTYKRVLSLSLHDKAVNAAFESFSGPKISVRPPVGGLSKDWLVKWENISLPDHLAQIAQKIKGSILAENWILIPDNEKAANQFEPIADFFAANCIRKQGHRHITLHADDVYYPEGKDEMKEAFLNEFQIYISSL